MVGGVVPSIKYVHHVNVGWRWWFGVGRAGASPSDAWKRAVGVVNINMWPTGYRRARCCSRRHEHTVTKRIRESQTDNT